MVLIWSSFKPINKSFQYRRQFLPRLRLCKVFLLVEELPSFPRIERFPEEHFLKPVVVCLRHAGHDIYIALSAGPSTGTFVQILLQRIKIEISFRILLEKEGAEAGDKNRAGHLLTVCQKQIFSIPGPGFRVDQAFKDCSVHWPSSPGS